jgi:hypothetical protein
MSNYNPELSLQMQRASLVLRVLYNFSTGSHHLIKKDKVEIELLDLKIKKFMYGLFKNTIISKLDIKTTDQLDFSLCENIQFPYPLSNWKM